MQIIAVTGGIGSGKTTAARRFAERGAVVVDLDTVARTLVLDPGPVHYRVVDEFGEAVLGPDGRVDPSALAAVAFASQEATQRLDGIVHPALLKEIMTGLTELELMDRPPRVIVLDIPLIVEAPAFAELPDSVLTISAPEALRIERSVESGMDPDDARARLARQATDEQREAIADSVIVNAGTLEEFHAALDEYWDREVV